MVNFTMDGSTRWCAKSDITDFFNNTLSEHSLVRRP